MVITFWRSAQAEAANRDEAEALTIGVLRELGLMVRSAHTLPVGAQALEPEWSRRPAYSLACTTTENAAGGGRHELLPELLALVRDCEEFENFQDRVKRW
jgi:hypothetical protein